MDADLEAQVDAYIDGVWEDVVADIAEVVSHPSVADTSQGKEGAPFGEPVRAALDCALGIAERLGYQTGDDEGYVGFADIPGERPEQVATIAHVDVVPAGTGWASDPFTMERREGWLLGRGVIDDKGPAILSLYAGAFLLHAGITPRYTFRALLGCDEEVGMTDVHHYLAGHDDPLFLFTPDAEFPVCNAEKGCYGATFVSGPIEGGRILSWSGAEVTNAIPGESVLEIAADADALPAPKSHADRIRIEAVRPGVARIVATGIGGHASLPAGTLNAIGLMVTYLREASATLAQEGKPGILAADEERFCDLLAQVHADTAGEGLGIATESDAFGPLTVNGGTIEVRDGHIFQTIDVRYPDSTTGEAMTEVLGELAARYGATLEVTRDKVPFSVSADHPAVQTLLDVYREVTGNEAKPFSMGGGTYARNFKRAVSFGPEGDEGEVPSWVGPMHGANEGANEALLRRALKIYILAIVRLMQLDL
ncbi:Sapep family Mn(2+)-dependent dipeptidase [Collinsella sp. An2]|uniref:Sapep family Mn(2+)-dependent dipeptidase n=1 Tax=Collinsella sp. An2 TaxID=1965585 RepID=UPI000B3A4515|nr:Sapep family Mn(2+)-dependent dipeptidase [Collinsella sp. An2]OUP08950.1 dipeptidase [Collinsella sp. An2]